MHYTVHMYETFKKETAIVYRIHHDMRNARCPGAFTRRLQ